MDHRSQTERRYDELLVTLVRTGDQRAAERLAARWYPRLLRTARRLLRDDDQARDAVQEAWMGICRGWMGLHDASRFPAWAFRILHHKCIDRIRMLQTRRLREAPSDASLPPTQSVSEDRYSLEQALSQLSPEHRAAAVLFFGEGLTLGELAEVTGVPLGTAKSRIFHARRQLKTAIKGEDP